MAFGLPLFFYVVSVSGTCFASLPFVGGARTIILIFCRKLCKQLAFHLYSISGFLVRHLFGPYRAVVSSEEVNLHGCQFFSQIFRGWPGFKAISYCAFNYGRVNIVLGASWLLHIIEFIALIPFIYVDYVFKIIKQYKGYLLTIFLDWYAHGIQHYCRSVTPLDLTKP